MIHTYAVIGDPIAQSKSPLMHQAAYQYLDLDARYVPFHVKTEHLQDAIQGMRALGIRGLNVTIPHKVAVMQYLDEIDPLAKQIGAVNTIVLRDGRLIGYNTDGLGYVRSLKEEMNFEPKQKTVLFVGAGGACRAIAFSLLREGVAKLIIANRTVQSALDLAELLKKSGDAQVEVIELNQLNAFLTDVDLIINTTSMGMYPHVEETPFVPVHLHPNVIVSDLIYNPMETRFLREAKVKGARTHGGLGMFVYQGALAFEYWFDQNAPIEVMRQTVINALGNRT